MAKNNESLASAGQFYESDEETEKDEITPAKLNVKVIDKCLYEKCLRTGGGAALVLLDDIADVIADSVIAQLKLVKIATMQLNSAIVTQIYTSRERAEGPDGIMLWRSLRCGIHMWTSGAATTMVSVKDGQRPLAVKEWMEVFTSFHCHKVFVLDALNVPSLPLSVTLGETVDGALRLVVTEHCQSSEGSRVVGSDSSSIDPWCKSFDRAQCLRVAPLLEPGVVIGGVCAALINYADARGTPSLVAAFVLSTESAFSVQTAKLLERVWEWLEVFVGASSSREGISGEIATSLCKPSATDYEKRKKSDSFLCNTDNMYT